MKKILLILALIGGTALTTFAQKTNSGKFSIGIDGGIIVGSTVNYASHAIGASIKYDHPINDHMFFTGSGGYTYLPYSNDFKIKYTALGLNQAGEGFVPLKVGLKYFFNNTLYGEGQLGSAISTQSGGGSAFAYAPGVGIKTGSADIGVRYEGWSKGSTTIGQFAARVAFYF